MEDPFGDVGDDVDWAMVEQAALEKKRRQETTPVGNVIRNAVGGHHHQQLNSGVYSNQNLRPNPNKEIRHEGTFAWPKPGQLGTNAGNKLEWVCPTCTLKNELSKSHCGACGKVNPNHKNEWSIGYKSYGAYGKSSKTGSSSSSRSEKAVNKKKRSSKPPAAAHRGSKPNGGGSVESSVQRRQQQQWTFGNFSKKAKSPPGKSFRMASQAPCLQGRPSVPVDPEAKDTWIYPTNYPVRDYQKNIVESALFQNTLVCLPTGLGKTLIASVVMYNYYRWFPGGKIIFMAPTKPLVEQQVKACHQIMSIPLEVTARLDGSTKAEDRKTLWQERQLFFCTPQTFRNDCSKNFVDLKKVVCLVFDEAHRATGNYAYVTSIQHVLQGNEHFRVLALSATPGSKREGVQAVMDNLLISHIEVRGDDDPDVRKYTHTKMIEFFEVKEKKRGVTERLRLAWVDIYRPTVRRLVARNILFNGDPEKLTKSSAWMACNRFRETIFQGAGLPGMSMQEAKNYLSQVQFMISLAHAHDLLKGHGLGSFVESLNKMADSIQNTRQSYGLKHDIITSMRFKAVHREAQTLLENGTVQHPKVTALIDLLKDHFTRAKNCGKETKAIIFTEFRSSVDNLLEELDHMRPLVQAEGFVGQAGSSSTKVSDGRKKKKKTDGAKTTGRVRGKGMTQKEQQRVMKEFREGKHNVLICTCIGEEGLDIGQVDLIVAFDAVGSPTRMTQRFGRTGRKRAGRVVVLMTPQDKKKQALATSKSHKIKQLLVRSHSTFMFYNRNPLMLPDKCDPKCIEQHMEISDFHSSQVGGAGGGENKKKPAKTRGYDVSASQRERCDKSWGLRLSNSQNIRVRRQMVGKSSLKGSSVLGVGQRVHAVPHSKDTELLLGILNFECMFSESYETFDAVDSRLNGVESNTTSSRQKKRSTWDWIGDDETDVVVPPRAKGPPSRVPKPSENKIPTKPEKGGGFLESVTSYLQGYLAKVNIDVVEYDTVYMLLYEKFIASHNGSAVYEQFVSQYKTQIQRLVDRLCEEGQGTNDLEDTMVVEDSVVEQAGPAGDSFHRRSVAESSNVLSETVVHRALEEVITEKLREQSSPLPNQKAIRRALKGKLQVNSLKGYHQFIKNKSVAIFHRLNCTDFKRREKSLGDLAGNTSTDSFQTPRPNLKPRLKNTGARVYEYGQAVEVFADSRWWRAEISEVLKAKSGQLYNIDGTERQDGKDWSMSEVSPSIIRPAKLTHRRGTSPKFATPMSVFRSDPNTGGKFSISSISPISYVNSQNADDSLENEKYDLSSGHGAHRVESAIKHYWNGSGKHKCSSEFVEEVFRGAKSVLNYRELVPSPPRFPSFPGKTMKQQLTRKRENANFETPRLSLSSRKGNCTDPKTLDKTMRVNTPFDIRDMDMGESIIDDTVVVDLEMSSEGFEDEASPEIVKKNLSRKKIILQLDDDDDDDSSSIGAPSSNYTPNNPITPNPGKKKKARFIPDDTDDDDSLSQCSVLNNESPANKIKTQQEIILIDDDGSEKDEPCSICRDSGSYDDNPILFCDGCNLQFHQHCYGVAQVPEGDFFCDMCKHSGTSKDDYKKKKKSKFNRSACVLCPSGFLPLQRCTSGKWVHPQCVNYTNELYFDGNVPNISNLNPERTGLTCELCSICRGSCIQCDASTCVRSFHVTCAQLTGNARLILDTSGAPSYRVYCSDHIHLFAKNSGRDGAKKRKRFAKPTPRRAKPARKARQHAFIDYEPEMVGDGAQHKDDMCCGGEENAYYDIHDSFINDGSQSSSNGDLTPNPLAFRNAFGSQESTPGLSLGGRRKAREDRMRDGDGGTSRVSMPIIERCMQQIRGSGNVAGDSAFEESQEDDFEEAFY